MMDDMSYTKDQRWQSNTCTTQRGHWCLFIWHIQKWRNLLSCDSSKKILFNLLQYNGDQCLTGNTSETKHVRIHVPWQHLRHYSICWSTPVHSRGSRHIQFPFCNSLVLKNLSLVSESFQQFGKGLDTKANILITILALVTFIYLIYFMCIPCADAFIGFALKCANTTWHHSLEATTHVTSPLVYNGSSLTSYTI